MPPVHAARRCVTSRRRRRAPGDRVARAERGHPRPGRPPTRARRVSEVGGVPGLPGQPDRPQPEDQPRRRRSACWSPTSPTRCSRRSCAGIEDVLDRQRLHRADGQHRQRPAARARPTSRSCRSRQVDGLHRRHRPARRPAAASERRRAGVPMVMVNRAPSALRRLVGRRRRRHRHRPQPSTTSSTLGHRDIAHLAGPAERVDRRRPAAARSATRCASTACATTAIVVADAYSGARPAGRRCVRPARRAEPADRRRRGQRPARPRLLRRLRRAGPVAVRDDISVVGFNDMPFIGRLRPPLTSVRVPQYELGVEAARLLLDGSAAEPPRALGAAAADPRGPRVDGSAEPDRPLTPYFGMPGYRVSLDELRPPSSSSAPAAAGERRRRDGPSDPWWSSPTGAWTARAGS